MTGLKRRIGVLGAGAMGRPIAASLMARGETVSAYDSSTDRRADLEAIGVSVAPSAAQLAAESDVLLTVLPEGDAVHQVMDVILGLPGGALWIDCSSSDPRFTDDDHERVRSRGIRPVTAPIRGGPDDAAAADLGFFVSGAPADVEAALDLLQLLGPPARTRVVGSRGSDAQLVKLIANALWFTQVVATSEALLLGASRGMDVRGLVDALRDSPGGSAYLDQHVDRLLAGDYMEDFALDRCIAELRTVAELAAEAGTPAGILELTVQTHEKARDALGPVMGELRAAQYLEGLAGRELRG